MKQFLLFGLVALALTFSNSIYSQITISDDGSGTGTTTWTSDNIYLLDGFVFVNEGQVLTIEAGTVIKGKPGSGADASALVVARGGKIMANGEADAPIIFTFENDPLDGSVEYSTRGQWGGLIILGNAGLNSTPGETQIEGIPDTEPRGLYGGPDDMDDSGVLNYVSIRHGGTDIGAGNEINGLTLGGVGSGTEINYVEVIANSDDGIELFGGTVNVMHAAVSFVGDDSFDYDEGWRGKGQFWFVCQDNTGDGFGDRGGEHDGGTNPETAAPYATPVIYNVTSMGRGEAAGKRALTFRDNAGGQYHNSIFYNWGKGVDIENLASGEDSYARFQSGELALAGNCFYNTAGNDASSMIQISMGSGWASESDSTDALTASTAAVELAFSDFGNSVEDPQVNYHIEEGSTLLNPVPQADVSGATAPTDAWYEAVTYKGAFEPGMNSSWLDGWTLLDERGFIGYVIGVEDHEFASNEVVAFPNPTTGLVNFVAPFTANNATLTIFDFKGAEVMNHQFSTLVEGTRFVYDFSDLSNGFYIASFINGNETRFVKIIKH